MALVLQCASFPLSSRDVKQLWRCARGLCLEKDRSIAIKCVSKNEVQELNNNYRGVNSSTNVLTFSYESRDLGSHHDIAICPSIVRTEARTFGVHVKEYAAWVLVHAFLHVFGYDHEKSLREAHKVEKMEREILTLAGYSFVLKKSTKEP